ncbi:MAG TPA: D-alanyl-D-alanine carboxypeptidase/D-alanyl-D-alanine-endopeptidase [Cyanobacteria bacterium UBA11149]|nr:D-alanyl-D-alanine carboxypeptidase/D-alanyl-D-alanine-endopeptidase [Cyanobacteria bacterium UBA11166]HBR72317.1 D-alanyl-D-alanine carboxypeptidase/D-alanyl-D-alanine-endopeptidase [Cyanobacteria bacterium UBA11159]HBW89371.1 D-alanyl-D-alanine carboxypeptidase/D-alanyl-D-alanine-endopeptidase [Cyanobacteria bacterium UBA11149]HCA97643.1 D-alanyl-D-alanine carboxypeptidase/D-alanyl-D-alanine-endopeptidase [Cyanobacteria bacterium UBA9226]
MKSVGQWMKPLAMLTCTMINWAAIAPQIQASARSATDLGSSFAPVEILVPPPENQDSDRVCPASLPTLIDGIISRPSVARANWGIMVASLSDGNVFYSHNASQSLIPASNVKLFTTAAALQKFDPNAKIGTTPLDEWVTITNTNSNNAYAEALLRQVGGVGAVKDTLSQLGINPNSYRLSDGSGLSRQNSASPTTLVQLLRAMSVAKNRDIFYSSLAVAGVSGTLKRRFHFTPVEGHLHGKTGTLKGVRSLSGYLEHPEYGVIVFSVIANQSSPSGDNLIDAIDDIVVQLSRLSKCY